MSQIKIGFDAKRGDSFALVGTVKLPTGNFAFRSHARDPVKGTKWVLAVSVGAEDPNIEGLFPFSVEAPPAMTKDWPGGVLEADIEVTDTGSGDVVHTEIFSIMVKNVVTRGA